MHDQMLSMEPPMTSGTPAWHRPALVEETVAWLAPQPGATVVDGTLGTGGHSLAILPHLMPAGRLIAIDRDPHALELAQQRLIEFASQIHFVRENFLHLPEILKRLQVTQLNGLLADLGLSSLHVDVAQRGFSFQQAGPLDMRMDPDQSMTAASLLQRVSEAELVRILEIYGEERWARRIARGIVTARRSTPIDTTSHLAQIIRGAVPRQAKSERLHPATRTFMALRIAVNDELANLEALLRALPELLAPQGRAVIITYHSLEDRLVKRSFQAGARAGIFRLLTKKPVRPSEQELAENPRSRSAKLRAVERLP